MATDLSFVIWQEHLIGFNKGLDETPKRLLVKDQLTIIRLEKQAEEFLSAVFCRKGMSWCINDGVTRLYQ